MKRILFYLLAILVLAWVGFTFIPRHYEVPAMKPLSEMRYWNLSTGSRLAYVHKEGKGNKKGTPVIFLQGGPGGFITDSTRFLDFVTEEGYDLYLYDQAGSGHSERLKDINEYTAERHVKDLDEIVKTIQAEKLILVGQSWGAILATLYTADHPDKIEKLILTGPGPVVPINHALESIMPPDTLSVQKPKFTNKMANEKVSNMRVKMVRLFAQWFGVKIATDREMDAFQTLLNNELNKSTVADPAMAKPAEGGGGYYVQIKTMQSLATTKDPRVKLTNNLIPVLILRGEYDNQPWGFVTEYFDLFKQHRFRLIKGAGHAIPREQKQRYEAEIRSFLNE